MTKNGFCSSVRNNISSCAIAVSRLKAGMLWFARDIPRRAGILPCIERLRVCDAHGLAQMYRRA